VPAQRKRRGHGARLARPSATLRPVIPHSLLRSQQDQVFEVVEVAGFDPRDFEWGYSARSGYDATPTLEHSSAAYFQFHHGGLERRRLWRHRRLGLEPEQISRQFAQARALTDQPFGLNFIIAEENDQDGEVIRAAIRAAIGEKVAAVVVF
jgi:hypothetical protein